jgi:hypothetical protein
LFLVVIIKRSEPFKGCVHNNKYRAQYEELHEGNAGFIARLTRFYLRSRLVAVCAANFADQNERVIGALAAIALAVFTLYLWRATHGLRRYAGIQAGDMQSLLSAAQNTATASASQVRAIEAQERVMRDQANTMTASLEAAQASADAAMKHVAIVQDTAKRQLRAYIAVQIVGIRGFREGWKAGFTMLVINRGQTPAYQVHTAHRVEILPRELPENYEFQYSFDRGELIINPHSQITSWASRDNEFTRVEVMELSETDDRRLYVFGVVQYTDAFNAKHRTRWCASISARTFKEGIAKVRGREDNAVVGHGSFEYSSQHNDAD